MRRVRVEAGGGVVWRPTPRGVEVLLIHRPRYDDWSFPKGKVERGEQPVDAALREVHEETGLRCALGAKLPSARYRDRKGRPKRVRYWAMTPVDGAFASNDEVDRISWVDLDAAHRMLSYPHDREVLDELAAVLVQV